MDVEGFSLELGLHTRRWDRLHLWVGWMVFVTAKEVEDKVEGQVRNTVVELVEMAGKQGVVVLHIHIGVVVS